MNKMQPRRFSWSAWLFIALMLTGFLVRMVDLTDAPFDFHPTRQLLDAIIARGMYFQMLPGADPQIQAQAVGLWQQMEAYELPVLPRLVALTYLAVGGEHLWIARIWTSLFWVLGGIPLFLLSRRLFSVKAALFAVAFYLFQPYGIAASRSFQPDPLMVSLLLWSVWSLVRWSETRGWKRAVVTGLLCGLALLVKISILFVLAGIALAVVLGVFGWRKWVTSAQVWLIAFLAALPTILYYFLGPKTSSSFFSFWSLSFSYLLLKSSFYGDVLQLIDGILGLVVFFVALAGVFLSRPDARRILLGYWIGYLAFIIVFPYHASTHDYYHLPILPLAALSLAPVVEAILDRVESVRGVYRWMFAGVVVLCAAYPLWITTRVMQATDYRAEAAGWARIGQQIPHDAPAIGLVHEYGHPLIYYGNVMVKTWPAQVDLSMQAKRSATGEVEFEALFQQRTSGYRYFLVTLPGELEAQPELMRWLNDHYPSQNGDGYLIYDLWGSR